MSFLSTDPCLSFWYLIPYLFHPVIYSGNSLFCYGKKKDIRLSRTDSLRLVMG